MLVAGLLLAFEFVLEQFLSPQYLFYKNLVVGYAFLFPALVMITLTYCRNEFAMETQKFGPYCSRPILGIAPVVLYVGLLYVVFLVGWYFYISNVLTVENGASGWSLNFEFALALCFVIFLILIFVMGKQWNYQLHLEVWELWEEDAHEDGTPLHEYLQAIPVLPVLPEDAPNDGDPTTVV